MRIALSSVYVDDQDKAVRFYTDVLGFAKKEDLPIGDYRWITLVAAEQPGGPRLLLEPDAHPAIKPFKDALLGDGIPFTSFLVDDVNAEYDRLKARGVNFTQPPTDLGNATLAVFEDTCGNLLAIARPHETAPSTG
ncbi:MAG TPA: VOC family protein [Solirubrobacteraceae bacterium]|nr:VOC family protein [Solirubrobacteraceae bacterium]